MTEGRTVAIVQARMGSTRLPGKVLKQLAGEAMVLRVLTRAAAVEGVDEIVAAIPDLPEDDDLARLIREAGYQVVRGAVDDVLSRFVLAADVVAAETIVRVTADCPFLSPRVSARVLGSYPGSDYASNTIQRTYPRGLDTEVISSAALRLAADEATEEGEREHVTPYIWRRPDRFRLRNVVDETDRSDMRWTVDTAEDLVFAEAIYDELGPVFEMEDVLALLKSRPELADVNSQVPQKPVS